MKTTRLTATACHRCGAVNDAATATDGGDKAPAPGNVALCVTCGALGVYTEDLIRPPTAPEMKEFLADPEIRRAVRGMRRWHESRRTPAAPPAGPGRDTHVPCGCVFGTRGDAFFIRPCSLTCKVYLYAAGEAKKQGKEMLVKREDT